MPKNFKAIVIDNKDEKFTREVKDLNSDHLKDGNVLVRIDFSSLNFKDALITILPPLFNINASLKFKLEKSILTKTFPSFK